MRPWMRSTEEETRLELRRASVRALGQDPPDPQAEEDVLRYCESPYRVPRVPAPVLPLPEEPHLVDWRRYAGEAGDDPFAYLRDRLPQLAIPVREGISKSGAYGEVMRRGAPFAAENFGGRLELSRPGSLRLLIHPHPAGALPVLATADRRDFETLLCALACRSEPQPVSLSVNAEIIAGLVNWDRVARYRAAWAAGVDPYRAMTGWPEEQARVAASERGQFFDRLLLVCDRPYSGVTAAALGLPLTEDEWLERSARLRIEHEFAHYATRRIFGAMSLNLFDETLADLLGVTHALGRFEASWFLRFLGLEEWPEVREDGRVHTYTKGLSPPAFTLLCSVVVRAARAIESLARRRSRPDERERLFLALASLGLDLLAADGVEGLFEEAWTKTEGFLGVAAGAAGQAGQAEPQGRRSTSANFSLA